MRFHCITFSHDGKRLLAGGGAWKKGGVNAVVGWDVADNKQVLKLVGHEHSVLCVRCSPDGKSIATGSEDGSIRLWSSEGGVHLRTLVGHKGGVESVAFSPDSKTLVSGSHDRTVRFWDIAQGKEQDRFETEGTCVRAVHLVSGGKVLVAGGGNRTLKALDVAGRKTIAALWNPSPVSSNDPQQQQAAAKPSQRWWLLAGLLVSLIIALALVGSFALAHYLRRRAATKQKEALKGAKAKAKLMPPTMTFSCSHCGKNIKVKTEFSGKKVRCPSCGKVARVPGPPLQAVRAADSAP